ncbi:MAG: hypothetical protein ACJAYU_001827 [Bradymonadia bacterium]|jgi:hypothetical protein
MPVIVPDSLSSVVPHLKALIAAAASRLEMPTDRALCAQPDFERELRDLTMALERSVHIVDLERFDVDVPGIVVNGIRYRSIGRSVLPVLLMAGGASVRQTMYRERGGSGGRSVGAVALQLALVDGRTTPAAAEVLSGFVARNTPEASSKLLALTRTISVSKSTLDRFDKSFSTAWEPFRVELEDEIRLDELRSATKPNKGAEVIAFSLDGCMVRMKDAPNTPGAAKHPDVPNGHQEATSAVVSLYGTDCERIRSIGHARMPESKKTTLSAQLLAELGAALERNPNASVVAMSDSAAENWRILREIAKSLGIEPTEITDYFHAAEHVSDGLKAAGLKGDAVERWCERLKDERCGAEACLAELVRRAATKRVQRSATRLKAVQREITYLNNNIDRMNYRAYQDAGLPIGTGVQEAACKTYIAARLKLSGMSWRKHGGQGVLTMRSLELSNRLGLAWGRLTARLRTAFTVDTNAESRKPSALRNAA